MKAARFVSVVICVGLVACSSGDQEELRQWMKEETKDLRGKIPPLPSVRAYEPVPYDATTYVDPFSSTKLKQDIKAAGGIQPDMNRAREALEAFPLETMKYVGMVSRNRQRFAILVADGALHQVKIGSYVGQNFGVVTSISDSEILLRELVQDPVGEWVERSSSLQLQPQTKEGK